MLIFLYAVTARKDSSNMVVFEFMADNNPSLTWKSQVPALSEIEVIDIFQGKSKMIFVTKILILIWNVNFYYIISVLGRCLKRGLFIVCTKRSHLSSFEVRNVMYR